MKFESCMDPALPGTLPTIATRWRQDNASQQPFKPTSELKQRQGQLHEHSFKFMYPPAAPTSYPPGPSVPDQKNIDLSGIPTSYDAERAERRKTQGNKSHNGRTSSWDILSGVRKIEQSYEEFDSRNASQAHLIYADGDTPKNKVRLILFTSL